MAVKTRRGCGNLEGRTDVKSPVASLCLVCSSVKKRVRVTMSVLILSPPTAPFSPLPFMTGSLVSLSGLVGLVIWRKVGTFTASVCRLVRCQRLWIVEFEKVDRELFGVLGAEEQVFKE